MAAAHAPQEISETWIWRQAGERYVNTKKFEREAEEMNPIRAMPILCGTHVLRFDSRVGSQQEAADEIECKAVKKDESYRHSFRFKWIFPACIDADSLHNFNTAL